MLHSVLESGSGLYESHKGSVAWSVANSTIYIRVYSIKSYSPEPVKSIGKILCAAIMSQRSKIIAALGKEIK